MVNKSDNYVDDVHCHRKLIGSIPKNGDQPFSPFMDLLAHWRPRPIPPPDVTVTDFPSTENRSTPTMIFFGDMSLSGTYLLPSILSTGLRRCLNYFLSQLLCLEPCSVVRLFVIGFLEAEDEKRAENCNNRSSLRLFSSSKDSEQVYVGPTNYIFCWSPLLRSLLIAYHAVRNKINCISITCFWNWIIKSFVSSKFTFRALIKRLGL